MVVDFCTITEDAFRATPEERVRMHIRPKITIFPWEDAKEELVAIDAE